MYDRNKDLVIMFCKLFGVFEDCKNVYDEFNTLSNVFFI